VNFNPLTNNIKIDYRIDSTDCGVDVLISDNVRGRNLVPDEKTFGDGGVSKGYENIDCEGTLDFSVDFLSTDDGFGSMIRFYDIEIKDSPFIMIDVAKKFPTPARQSYIDECLDPKLGTYFVQLYDDEFILISPPDCIPVRTLLDQTQPEPTPVVEVKKKKSSGGCTGDCTPPTFGENKSGKLLVKNGFELNGVAVDVENYHVPYDLITVNTNETYNMKLKVYESTGLKWIQVGFGLPEIGSPMNDAESIVLFRIGYDDILDELETVDKESLIDIKRASLSTVSCEYMTSDCYLLDFDFTPREQLKNNVVLIQAVDVYGYSISHYVNDGMLVIGESMNEAPTYKLFNKKTSQQTDNWLELVRIDRVSDVWVDQNGIKYQHMSNDRFDRITPAEGYQCNDKPLNEIMSGGDRTNCHFREQLKHLWSYEVGN